MLVSIVMGWPSSSISSMSWRECQRGSTKSAAAGGTHHVHRVEIILERRLGHVAEIGRERLEKRLEKGKADEGVDLTRIPSALESGFAAQGNPPS